MSDIYNELPGGYRNEGSLLTMQMKGGVALYHEQSLANSLSIKVNTEISYVLLRSLDMKVAHGYEL